MFEITHASGHYFVYENYTVKQNNFLTGGGARTSTGGGECPPLPQADYAPGVHIKLALNKTYKHVLAQYTVMGVLLQLILF